MSTFTQSIHPRGKAFAIGGGGIALLIWAAIASPNFIRSGRPVNPYLSPQLVSEGDASKSTALYSDLAALKSTTPTADVANGRKIVRSSSMEIVVQRPSETLDRISALVEGLGGYVVSANAGGQTSTAANLSVRIPAARFEEARTDIRKLGIRVESESVEAKDVTKQYVDEEASTRNLKAQEAQYLVILKQATTVKDMLAVSEKLSEVRGQIEQQQAEFNTLSQQIETVAISIVLRTEAEARVFPLNLRPGYQIKLALRDGLESLANYVTAMTTVVFYLPAALLWAGTVLAAGIATWRVVARIGRRWFGWKGVPPAPEIAPS